MSYHDQGAEYKYVELLVRRAVNGAATCDAVIDAYEQMARLVWDYVARLIGDGGTRAVMSRSVQVTGRACPRILAARVDWRSIDFSNFRTGTQRQDCTPDEITDALSLFSVNIFRTLGELTGDILTAPLFAYLTKQVSEWG